MGKIKPIIWVMIIAAAVLVPLILVFIITKLVLDASWWWTGGLTIIEGFIGVILATILIVTKIQKKTPPKVRLDPKTAKKKAIVSIKEDPDNPDNFMVENQVIQKVGQTGSPRTPVLHLSGRGSEINQRIDVIINLDNPKLEATILRNATKDQVSEAIRLIAENPETEITERITTGIDSFGRPTQTVITKKVKESEKEEADAKKEAEQQNVM